MRHPALLAAAVLVAIPAIAHAAGAGDEKLYKEGPISEVTYVKIKPGHFEDYMKYLDTTFKRGCEINKKAGLVVSCAVYGATARHPTEADLILVTTYPNFATLDQTAKFEETAKQLEGTLAQQEKAFADRGEFREILGSELVRELILK